MKNLKKEKSKDILAKSKNKVCTTQKGITLIALVITIIILLILAAVTIAALSGDNGILSNAAKAKQETEKAEILEQIRLDIYGEMADNGGADPTEDDIVRIADKYGDIEGTNFDDMVLKTDKGNYEIELSDIWTSGSSTVDPDEPDPSTTLQPGETATAEKNEYYDAESDKPDVPAIIPVGFTVSNVPGETTINGGLVIYYIPEGTNTSGDFWTAQDSEGVYNVQKEYDQYIWIPVDGIIGEDGDLNDVNAENIADRKILLGRYVFKSDGTVDTTEGTTPTTIGETLTDEDGDEFTEDTPESHNPSYGNAIATGEEGEEKGINVFIQSVRENGGYYIARYEAGVTGYDVNNIQTSNSNSETSWTGYNEESSGSLKLVSKSGERPWNYVTQNKASELCQNLYTVVNSDLINSYAWDTAILFIQKYEDSDYSRQVGRSTTPSQLANTGEGKLSDTNDFDKQCNIYDMAGNCWEWTTETYSDSYYPCVYRGGSYNSSIRCTSGRRSSATTFSNSRYSFRSLLYL